YRPRPNVKALAKQYFHYGRWRHVVARTHPGTINMRYLAPPAAVVGVAAGLVAAPFFWPALILPLGYLAAILAGSVVTGSGLPAKSRLWLPIAYITMHMSWGLGFLTSPPSLAKNA